MKDHNDLIKTLKDLASDSHLLLTTEYQNALEQAIEILQSISKVSLQHNYLSAHDFIQRECDRAIAKLAKEKNLKH